MVCVVLQLDDNNGNRGIGRRGRSAVIKQSAAAAAWE